MMRYTVGHFYPFVHCKFRYKNGYVSSTGLYVPWEIEQDLLDLQVVVLKCVLHEKVPSKWETNGEKKYDGFIFEYEADRTRWLNQFPRAVYGQLSDDADRILNIDWQSTGLSVKELMAQDDTVPARMTALQDGKHFLSNIRRGQHQIAEQAGTTESLKRVYIKALQAFEKQVQELMEKATGKKLRLLQDAIRPRADDSTVTHHLINAFEVIFEDDPKFAMTNAWQADGTDWQFVEPAEIKL